jgi:hypothetical protein
MYQNVEIQTQADVNCGRPLMRLNSLLSSGFLPPADPTTGSEILFRIRIRIRTRYPGSRSVPSLDKRGGGTLPHLAEDLTASHWCTAGTAFTVAPHILAPAVGTCLAQVDSCAAVHANIPAIYPLTLDPIEAGYRDANRSVDVPGTAARIG